MKIKTAIIALVAFCCGAAMQLAISRVVLTPGNPGGSISHHWRVVNDFNEYLQDPDNYSVDSQTGLHGIELSYAPEPSLAALVAAGELEHVDLVLPLVPATPEANRYWMRFVSQRSDTIVHSSGNMQYVDYKPAGEPPLHLKLWFRKSAEADVQQLISELETLARPE